MKIKTLQEHSEVYKRMHTIFFPVLTITSNSTLDAQHLLHKKKIKIFNCDLFAWSLRSVALVNTSIFYSEVLLQKSA